MMDSSSGAMDSVPISKLSSRKRKEACHVLAVGGLRVVFQHGMIGWEGLFWKGQPRFSGRRSCLLRHTLLAPSSCPRAHLSLHHADHFARPEPHRPLCLDSQQGERRIACAGRFVPRKWGSYRKRPPQMPQGWPAMRLPLIGMEAATISHFGQDTMQAGDATTVPFRSMIKGI